MNAATTLRLVELGAVAVVAQKTIEEFLLRKAVSDQGIWSHRILRREYLGLFWPLGFLFDSIFSWTGTRLLWVVQVLACAGLLVAPGFVSAICLFATALLISARFRGAFNGGSDAMTVQILFSICLAEADPRLREGALIYLGLQVTLSYFIAGVVKIREPGWRDGSSLREFLGNARYGAPDGVVAFFSDPWRARLASAAILAFELLFPLFLLQRLSLAVALLAGAFFHLGNAAVFGLNRFLFAWLAAYPAVVYFAGVIMR